MSLIQWEVPNSRSFRYNVFYCLRGITANVQFEFHGEMALFFTFCMRSKLQANPPSAPAVLSYRVPFYKKSIMSFFS